MTRAPLVSVVIPTYNRSALLQETLTSILRQTFQDFEIVIVDNMSSDDTEPRVAAMHEPRITYLRNPNHGVIAVNRNVGIRRATGKYVAFCDDDDLWREDKLERQVAVMEADAAAGMCYTDGCTFMGDTIVHARMVSRPIRQHHFRHLLWDNGIPSSSVLVRSTALAAAGLIDETPELLAVEDYEMWLRLAHREKLVFLDEPLIRYRLHAGTAGLRPAAVSLRNIRVLRSIQRKLQLPAWLVAPAVARQYAKHVYFRLAGR